MNGAINVSEEKMEYVQNLMLYINEVKPFRTKLVGVTETISAHETVLADVSYSLDIEDN
jgi:hypothetical protein